MVALVTGLFAWVAIQVFFRAVGFDVIRSDVAEYVEWSHHWWRIETLTHIPGYPIVIWVVRLLSAGTLPDEVLFPGVALACWAAGVYAVDRIFLERFPDGRLIGTVAYALFPFVGLTYVAYPVSDALAGALLAFDVLALLREQWGWFAVCLAAGSVVHKALWPTWALICLPLLLQKRMPWWVLLVGSVPILSWVAWGYQSQSGLWWVRNHVDHHLTYHQLPVFDGLLGPLIEGGLNKYIKLVVVWTGLLVAAGLAVWAARRRDWLLVGIALPTVFWMIILNEVVIWAAIRHERLVVLPFVVWFMSDPRRAALAQKPAFVGVVASALVVTQLGYAWYMWAAFFAA